MDYGFWVLGGDGGGGGGVAVGVWGGGRGKEMCEGELRRADGVREVDV